MGQDFPAERFLRTPVRTVMWVLREMDDLEKGQANIHSISTAQLANLLLRVAHGFSGSKRAAPKSKPDNFLPFPGWRPAGTEADGPDQPTKFILSELLRGRRIPIHVFAALTTPASQRT